MRRSVQIFTGYALAAAPAFAHEGRPLEPHDALTAWVWDPGVVIPLVIAAVLYVRGASVKRGIAVWEQACYWAGWVTLAIALVSPVHAVGEVLFSVHMTQHELLMAVAAPLLVLGRPLVAYVWALPVNARRPVANAFRARPLAAGWAWLKRPFVAGMLHFFALWTWHVPALFEATLTSDAVHAAQHLSFFLTALIFWWALIRGHGAKHFGAAVAYLFFTGLHTSILGALLTFSSVVWYPTYADTAAWGLTPLEDQQLGGLIMWVPASLSYLVAGLALFALWLRECDVMVRRAESSGA